MERLEKDEIIRAIVMAVSNASGYRSAKAAVKQVLASQDADITRARSRRVSRRMTTALAQGVVMYKIENPQATHDEMAELFKVNPGRISEVLSGKREWPGGGKQS